MKRFWLASAAFSSIAAMATIPLGTAAAQEQAQEQAQNTSQATADTSEIIVTATRRAQLLSDVPIAISAVSGDQLRNSGGNDIRQLNQLAPSLFVSTATNESNGVARIRGIGTVGENPGLESSVAVFIDGVYRSRTGVGLTDLGELDRIEVLRGPQGTLFGRNASAGLINIITAMPKFEAGGIAEATYGNFNNVRLAGSLYGPLSEKIAFRVDGLYNKRDGFLTDVVSGRGLADRDRFLVRGQLLIKPTDDISIRLIGDYNQKNEECCGASFITPIVQVQRDAAGNVIEVPNGLRSALVQLGAIYPQATGGDAYVRQTSITPGESYDQRTRDWGLSGELNWDVGAVKLTSITAYREFKNKAAQDADFQVLDILRRRDQDRRFRTFTQELRLQGTMFNDRLDFLVGGYFANEDLFADDDIKYGNDYERFSACVLADNFARGTGQPGLVDAADVSCFNRPLATALIGNTAIPAATRGQIALLSGLGPIVPGGSFSAAGGFRSVASAIGFDTAGGLLNDTGIVQDTYDQNSRNYAIFTHNVVSIIPDKVLLTLGGRYTSERKQLTAVFNHNNNFCAALRSSFLAALQGLPCVINGTTGPGFNPSSPGGTINENRFTGTAVLSVKPVDELLVYGSYSRGYKAGGFNLDSSALNAATPSARDLSFQPEDVNAFELGAKLDLRSAKINLALFYQGFKNFQLNTFNGVNFEVSNIGGCKASFGGLDRDLVAGNSACPAGQAKDGVVSKGLEVEALLFPVRDLTFSGGFTYADTRYADNLTGSFGNSLAPTLFQLPGQPLSNAQAYTATSSIAFTPDIVGTNLSSLFYIDMRYSSALNTGSDLDREKLQPAFIVANARIGIYGPDRRWGIEVWGQNLFDTLYQQVAADAPLQGGGTFDAVARGLSPNANGLFITFPAEPRTFGVTVRSQF